MLSLATILLVTLLTAVTVVWLYRTLSGWHGFKATLVSRDNRRVGMSLKAQQGYISLIPASREKAINVRLRSPKGGVRAPWGW